MAAAWRLIVDGALDGAWNMAVDRALLESRNNGGPPTLRLYSWSVPTITLGRFQPVSDVDLDACRDLGVDVVRRPTGGRGVLHDDEVTYSVVASAADGVPRGVRAAYAYLCSGLVEAYHLLGVSAELTRGTDGTKSAACYLLSTPADLVLGAAKLSGSAQVWSGEACLQHGSLVMSRDAALEARAFGLGGGGEAALAEHAVTLAEVLHETPVAAAVAEAVIDGFGRALGIELPEGGLSARERARAETYADEARLLGVRGSG